MVDRQASQDYRDSTNHIGARHERVVERDCGLLGCSTRSRPSTTYSAGIHAGDHDKTEAILEIRLGKGVRPEEGDSYDALKIRDNLRQGNGS